LADIVLFTAVALFSSGSETEHQMMYIACVMQESRYGVLATRPPTYTHYKNIFLCIIRIFIGRSISI